MAQLLQRSLRHIVLFAVTAVSIAVMTPAAAAPGEPQPSARPVATTTNGPVRGTAEGDAQAFLGIPYAAPPTGQHRFKAPVAPQPWTEPRAAGQFGPACPQRPSAMELAAGEPISEDCLSLNVWTPSLTGSAPVIVFVHGGGFTAGSTRNPWYDGAQLAARGATVVTIQYRIGPFGWLDLSELGPDYTESMNNGLLDQIAALRWVRENIGGFGGDPKNVTLVGESAGAISVSALLGAPRADGLYDRVILQSGTAANVATPRRSREMAQAFTAAADLRAREQILGLDTEQMLSAADKVYESKFADTVFHPVVDGNLLPHRPAERIAAPDGPRVPVIVGTTLDEARYWLAERPDAAELPRAEYQAWLESLVGDRAEAVFRTYKMERPALTDTEAGLAMAGDVSFRMPSIRMAEALSRRGVDVRMYLATVAATALDGRMGSPHAVELPFVFGTTGAASDFVADDATNRQLSERVQDLWLSFARDGQPSSRQIHWPRYNVDTRETLILDPDLRIAADPYPMARIAWAGIGFDGADPSLERSTPFEFEQNTATRSTPR